jgi:hypothetical protein
MLDLGLETLHCADGRWLIHLNKGCHDSFNAMDNLFIFDVAIQKGRS